MKKTYVLLVSLVMFSLLAGCGGDGCSTGSGSVGNDDSPVYAKMDGKTITENSFMDELEKISPFAKNQFKGVEGKMRMLDRMIQNEVLYKAAIDAGYDKNDEVAAQIEEYKKNMIVREYYKKEVQEKSQLDDEELQAYYAENSDKYKEKARVKVRHILADNESGAKKILAELDRGGDFKALAKEKSKDKLSSKREGLLGNVLEGGYIPTIGRDDQIENTLFSTPVNQYTSVVESKKGFHVFYIDEKKEARQKDFEEVKELIQGELRRTRMRDDFEGMLEGLKQQYHVEIFEENMEDEEEEDTGIEQNIFGSDQPIELKFEPKIEGDEEGETHGSLGIDEMFRLAGDRMNAPEKALDIYHRIEREHPSDPSVYKAIFMVGFINAEHLGRLDTAKDAFGRLLHKFPKCDLADDADFMLAEIKSGKFTEAGSKKNPLT